MYNFRDVIPLSELAPLIHVTCVTNHGKSKNKTKNGKNQKKNQQYTNHNIETKNNEQHEQHPKLRDGVSVLCKPSKQYKFCSTCGTSRVADVSTDLVISLIMRKKETGLCYTSVVHISNCETYL